MEQCTANAGFNAAMVLGGALMFSLVALGIWQCYGRYVWLPRMVRWVANGRVWLKR